MPEPPYCNLTIPQELCTLETCCIQVQGWLTYLPTVAGNSVYLGLFGLLLLIQSVLGIRWRTWSFSIGILCGCVLEIVGYAARIALHQDIFNKNYFIMYLVCLTLGPAFVTVSVYLCLGRLVQVYGARFSRIQSSMYTLVFVSCDIVSLVLQAVGGGIASASQTSSGVQVGTNIMVAGLAFQVFSLLLFMLACGDFARRVRKGRSQDRPERFASLTATRNFKLFLWALAIATITVFVRCVFRVAELQGGFDSAIANDQVAFMILEGPMILIAVGALTLLHPGFCFGGRWAEADFKFIKKTKTHDDVLSMTMDKTSSKASTIAEA